MALTIYPNHDAGTAKSVLKYALLPGVMPRLKRLGWQLSGIFFMFTRILGMTGLIEEGHPCLRYENRGQYSFVHTLLYAWHNLKFSHRTIPQIIMFFTVAASCLVLMGILCFALLYVFTSFGEAHAQYFGRPDGASGIPYDVNQDWAFQFLERIFGGQTQTGLNFWIQNEQPGNVGNPWFSSLLVGVLKVYSQAMLLVASFMIMYIFVVTLADAARSGRPFGESFDGIWAPLRFAIALGLLLPLGGGGYNGAQLMVFQTAEWGSNMATNIWYGGLKKVAECDESGNIGDCNFFHMGVQDRGYKFLRDMFLINLCIYGYSAAIEMGGISDKNAVMSERNVSQKFWGNGEIHTFGNKNSTDFCGQVYLPQAPSGGTPAGYVTDGGAPAGSSREPDSYLPHVITRGYREAAMRFFPPSGIMQEVAMRFSEEAYCKQNQILTALPCPSGGMCNDQLKNWIKVFWEVGLGRKKAFEADDGKRFFEAYDEQAKKYNQWIADSLRKDAAHGWAAAGVFYLRISGASTAMINAISDMPRVTMLPRNYHRLYATPMYPNIDDNVAIDRCSGWFSGFFSSLCDSFGASKTLNTLIRSGESWFRNAAIPDSKFYSALGGYRYDNALRMPDSDGVETNDTDTVLSPIISIIYEAVRIDGSDMNPLGTVINWGNVLFTIASTMYTLAVAASLIGLIPGFGAAMMISSYFEMAGNIFVLPGFILMFVVPFLPFMYFTFAVVEWAVAVLEAVIGMPLWVLTFIQRQGDLLKPAMGGIKMLFEIMLRPVIVIFSLLAAILVFTAGVVFFGDAMRLFMEGHGAMSSESGNGLIGGIFSLGLILVYMFGVYSLATSSFKLIDAIPAQFGRWLGMEGGFGSSPDGGAFSAGVNAVAMGGVVAGIGQVNKMRRDAVNAVSEGISARMTEKDYQDYLRRKREEALNSKLFGSKMPPDGSSPSSGTGGYNWTSTSTADVYGDKSKGLPGADDNYGYGEPGQDNTKRGPDANVGAGSTGTRQTTGENPINKAYSVFGLTPDATQEEVREAYKKQIMKTHPDNLNREIRSTYFEQYKRDLMGKFGIQPKESLQEKLTREAEARYGAKNVSNEERARIRKEVEAEYKNQLNSLTADQKRLLADIEARYKEQLANASQSAAARSEQLRTEIEDAYKKLNELYTRGRGGPQR